MTNIVVLYLVLLLGVGAWKAFRVKTHEDFALAGRSLSPWILVGTMLATWIGTGSILGNAGKAYEIGFGALILPAGGVLGIALLTQISGKIRGMDTFTVPEIIYKRFGSGARNWTVVALVLAYLVIVSYQYNAGGAVLHTIFNSEGGQSWMTLERATMVAALFIVLYTVLAGLLSVVYTDVANGVIMTLVLVIAFPILWLKAGGMSGMQQSFILQGNPEKISFFGRFTPLQMINYMLPPFLLVLGDANMYQRFSAAASRRGISKATLILILAVLLIECLIIATAAVSASLVPDADNGRHILIHVAANFLPDLLGGLFFATIIGIIISTADSYLLVPATTLMRDIYLSYINPQADDHRIVLYSRTLVIILGFAAWIISKGFANSPGFFERALYAYTIYGAAITPSLMAALFWQGATPRGALYSIGAGVTTTILWQESPIFAWLLGENIVSNTDAVLPAITLSILFLVFGSLWDGGRSASAT
ncbi:MAG: sodium:solute symporter family protein [Candidatus Marinimicrobia bacterium]|nr:sodium:solute symporter family protein [Candidatus Neomarinimicrobiota bacterium]